MKTGRTGGLLAGVVALGLALAAGAETWNDGSRTWRYYITSVQTSVGAWRQGAALQSGDMRWNYETGMYESTPCVEPAPVGALTVPSELPLVTTNGWNEWVGTELVHYETVTTNWLPLVRIGYNAFSGCTSLTSVTLPPTVAEIDSAAFLNCTSLADVTGLDAVRKFDQTAFAGTPWWDAYTNGKEFVVLNGTLFMYNGAGGDVTVPEGVAVIGSNVFSYRSDLRRVVLPASASKIQDSAFTGSSVTDIAWGGVTEIGSSAFANCTGLTSVTLPDALTSISWGTFQGCSQLATVRGGASVTSVGMNAFSGTPLTDPAAASFKLGVIGSVLYGYAGTAAGAVDIPEGVATLSDAYMFKGNTAITALTLPSTLVDNALYSEMFRDCTSLREVVIKSTRYSSSIPSRMFMGCTALTSVTLPANLWSIGESAFEDCDALATIDLPKSLGRLYEKAFAYSGLETVTGAEGLYSVGSGAFEGTPLLDR